MLARCYLTCVKKLVFFKFLYKQNNEYSIHLKKEKNDILTSKIIQINKKFI